MFSIKSNPQLNKDSFNFSKNGAYPYFTRTVTNNGILGYVDYLDEEHKVKGKCLAVGMIAMQFFYMEKDFYAGQFTKRAVPIKFSLNQKRAIFLSIVLNKHQKTFQNLLVRDFEKTFEKVKVKLPIKNDEIDFEFMDSFITTLEAERMAKLDAYLLATGLKEYKLTADEQKVIAEYDRINWQEFKIGDLFDRIKTKKLPFKADELPKEEEDGFTLPCLTSSFKNQGLNYFAPKYDATILKNVISIPSNSDVYRAYYQSNEFTVLSDAYAIRWIFSDDDLQPNQYLFAVPCINKVTDLSIYSYKNKLGGWNVVKDKYIQLPIKNNKPDYAIMDTLISAIKKLIIKDVVLYTQAKTLSRNNNDSHSDSDQLCLL